MFQRTAPLVALTLLTVVIILAAGVAANAAQVIMVSPTPTTSAAREPATPTAAPIEPDLSAVKAQVLEREATLVAAANRQTEQANEQLRRLSQQRQILVEELERLQQERQRLAEPTPVASATAPAAEPAPPPPPPTPEAVAAVVPPPPPPPPPTTAPRPARPQPPSEPPPTATPLPAPRYPVSADQAAAIATGAAPGTTLRRAPELVDFQGMVAYEVTLDRGQIYVDATTGRILHNSVPAPTATHVPPRLIGPEKAAEIALHYLGSGTVTTVTLTDQRGVKAYEVVFSNGSKVYVHAFTGEVIYAQVVSKKPTPKPTPTRPPRRGHDDDDDDDD